MGKARSLTIAQLLRLKNSSLDVEKELQVATMPQPHQKLKLERERNGQVVRILRESSPKLYTHSIQTTEPCPDRDMIVGIDIFGQLEGYQCAVLMILGVCVMYFGHEYKDGSYVSNSIGLAVCGMVHSRYSRSLVDFWEGSIVNPFVQASQDKNLQSIVRSSVVGSMISMCSFIGGVYILFVSSSDSHPFDFVMTRAMGIVEELVAFSLLFQTRGCVNYIPLQVVEDVLLSTINTMFGVVAAVFLWITLVFLHYDTLIGFESLRIEPWIFWSLIQSTSVVIATSVLGYFAQTYRIRLMYRIYTFLVLACLAGISWAIWQTWKERIQLDDAVTHFCPYVMPIFHLEYWGTYFKCEKYSELGSDLVCLEPTLRVEVWEEEARTSDLYHMGCMDQACCNAMLRWIEGYINILQLSVMYLVSLVFVVFCISTKRSLDPSDHSRKRQILIQENFKRLKHDQSIAIELSSLGFDAKTTRHATEQQSDTKSAPLDTRPIIPLEDATLLDPKTSTRQIMCKYTIRLVFVFILSSLTWIPWMASSITDPRSLHKPSSDASLEYHRAQNGTALHGEPIWSTNASAFEDNRDVASCVSGYLLHEDYLKNNTGCLYLQTSATPHVWFQADQNQTCSTCPFCLYPHSTTIAHYQCIVLWDTDTDASLDPDSERSFRLQVASAYSGCPSMPLDWIDVEHEAKFEYHIPDDPEPQLPWVYLKLHHEANTYHPVQTKYLLQGVSEPEQCHRIYVSPRSPSPPPGEAECAALGCDPLTSCLFDHVHGAVCSECPAGTALDPIASTCVDIDECALDPNSKCALDPNHTHCAAPDGSWQGECRCNAHLAWDIATQRCLPFEDDPLSHADDHNQTPCPAVYQHHAVGCTDIDECLHPHVCPVGMRCQNLPGSFRCIEGDCRELPGYQWAPDEATCHDVDECLSDPCPYRHQQCVNLPGGYACQSTQPSWTPLDCNHSACVRFQTCTQTAADGPRCGDCTGGRILLNQTACVFLVPPCDLQPCAPNKPCHPMPELPEGYQCGDCPEGYEATLEGTCADLNECDTHPGRCQTDLEQCVNTEGGYQCVPWSNTLPLNPACLQCDPLTRCIEDEDPKCTPCPEGFQGNPDLTQGGAGCVPFQNNNHTATPELFKPASTTRPCPAPLFDLNATGHCVDRDECLHTPGRASPCPEAHLCQNLQGEGFECIPEPCTPGWEWNNQTRTCVDQDECRALYTPCPSLRPCINQIGSYACGPCPAGFTISPHNESCVDIDECLSDPCHPQRRCINMPGTFVCDACASGYINEGNLQCVRSDPCEQHVSPCDPLVNCTVHLSSGLAECGPCPTGFQDVYANGTQCIDIDECLSDHPCPPDSSDSIYICHNIPGSHYCISSTFRRNTTRVTTNATHVFNDTNITTTHVFNATSITSVEPSCAPGYTWDVLTSRCIDVDECRSERPIPICPSDTRCINLDGGHACDAIALDNQTCPNGFVRSGSPEASSLPALCLEPNETVSQCVNVDECCVGIVLYHSFPCPLPRTCRDLNGSFACDLRCEQGYLPDTAQGLCIDIDECQDLDVACMPLQTCLNIQGGYTCLESCTHPGYAWDPDHQACIDIDECQSDICDPVAGGCLNLEGSYQCIHPCPSPLYTGDPDLGRGSGCQYVDPCPELDCHPMTTCLPNELRCSPCPPGYQGPDCRDVDECTAYPGLCDPRWQRCQNLEGGYQCSSCPTGFRRVYEQTTNRSLVERCEDVNECAVDSPPCEPGRQPCVNLEGSYRCEGQCPGGYVPEGPHRCVDLDECQLRDASHCDPLAVCTNTNGSYTCGECPAPFYRGLSDLQRGGGGCVRVDLCAEWTPCDTRFLTCHLEDPLRGDPRGFRCDGECPNGYELDSLNQSCLDVDECLSAPCLNRPPCVNLDGSYRCQGTCPNGTYPDGTDGCADIDECIFQPCNPAFLSCVNTFGGFACEGDCPEGTMLDPEGVTCLDVDECLSDPCHNCTNTFGNYTCTDCPDGFRWSNQSECLDIDECAEDDAEACPHLTECINLNGSFACGPCPSGYILNHSQCVDVDECTLLSQTSCDPLQTCTNLNGSFECGPCPTGYVWNQSKCTDVDECTTSDGPCDAWGLTCRNRPGDYVCDGTCPPGYRKDPDSAPHYDRCIDVDECASSHLAVCDPRTHCVNLEGSFYCTPCPEGFEGDPLLSHAEALGCVRTPPCRLHPYACDPLTRCLDLSDTNWTCSECPDGYQSVRSDEPGGWHRCLDVDECALGRCAPQSFCVNQVGGFQCGPCPVGYREAWTHDGSQRCIDIDECTSNHSVCDSRVQCHNQNGSYICGPCPEHFVATFNTSHKCIPGWTDPCPSACPMETTCTSHYPDAPGGVECGPCPSGFVLDAHSIACVDRDECIEPGICGGHRDCENTHGAYRCGSCHPGFEWDPAFEACVDVDECVRQQCGDRNCTNLDGSFECGTCPQGRWLRLNSSDQTQTTCEDMDECGLNLHTCDTTRSKCLNTFGSYVCIDDDYCPSGFQTRIFDGNSHVECVDVDECDLNHELCDPRTQCINHPGGYTCTSCPSGFEGSGVSGCMDVDECLLSVCDPRMNCTNLAGSFECGPCPAGFNQTSEGRCEDIDECALDHQPSRCDPLQRCINQEGFYECGPCPAGYVLSATRCEDVDECASGGLCDPLQTCTNLPGSFACGTCPFGYIGERECRDVDECETDPCDPRTSCRNLPGGFECGECPPGFTGDGLHGCVDIDECEEDVAHYCGDALRGCVNTPGSFQCLACPPGFWTQNHTGKAGGCLDVDECARDSSAMCDVRSNCTNIRGGYLCDPCPPGFSGSPYSDRGGCVDVDECVLGQFRCDPDAACVNTPGGYECHTISIECPLGYHQEGIHCVDIDECHDDTWSPCVPPLECLNLNGSFRCRGECPSGFAPDTLRVDDHTLNHTLNHTLHHTQCTDVDECLETPSVCAALVECTNTEGSYVCGVCPYGYRGDGRGVDGCVDVDECVWGGRSSLICGPHRPCHNLDGGYTCGDCPSGFVLAGEDEGCVDVDECAQEETPCGDALRPCLNLEGSFQCLPCPDHYELVNDTQCVEVDACRPGPCDDTLRTCDTVEGEAVCGPCPDGFLELDAHRCRDIDECQIEGTCDPLVQCTNSPGGYQCGECPDGYVIDAESTSHRCVDVDECVLGEACDPRMECINLSGSYRCGPCPPGFEQVVGRRCVDVDECDRYGSATMCQDPFRVCHNVEGGFECPVCMTGYTPSVDDGDAGRCVDVDECQALDDVCDATPSSTCVNLPGTYRCDCVEGYRPDGNGVDCVDVDECKQSPRACDPAGLCRNTDGGFECDGCIEGYTGDGHRCDRLEVQTRRLQGVVHFLDGRDDTAVALCDTSAHPECELDTVRVAFVDAADDAFVFNDVPFGPYLIFFYNSTWLEWTQHVLLSISSQSTTNLPPLVAMAVERPDDTPIVLVSLRWSGQGQIRTDLRASVELEEGVCRVSEWNPECSSDSPVPWTKKWATLQPDETLLEWSAIVQSDELMCVEGTTELQTPRNSILVHSAHTTPTATSPIHCEYDPLNHDWSCSSDAPLIMCFVQELDRLQSILLPEGAVSGAPEDGVCPYGFEDAHSTSSSSPPLLCVPWGHFDGVEFLRSGEFEGAVCERGCVTDRDCQSGLRCIFPRDEVPELGVPGCIRRRDDAQYAHGVCVVSHAQGVRIEWAMETTGESFYFCPIHGSNDVVTTRLLETETELGLARCGLEVVECQELCVALGQCSQVVFELHTGCCYAIFGDVQNVECTQGGGLYLSRSEYQAYGRRIVVPDATEQWFQGTEVLQIRADLDRPLRVYARIYNQRFLPGTSLEVTAWAPFANGRAQLWSVQAASLDEAFYWDIAEIRAGEIVTNSMFTNTEPIPESHDPSHAMILRAHIQSVVDEPPSLVLPFRTSSTHTDASSSRPWIEWGDGSADFQTSHTYRTPGVYEVRCWVPSSYAWRRDFGTEQDAWLSARVLEVIQFGDMRFANDQGGHFRDFPYLDLQNAQDTPSHLHEADLTHMFENAIALTSLGATDAVWDLSGVLDLSAMFKGCTQFEAKQVERWDVSSVRSLRATFQNSALHKLDLKRWEVEQVEDMDYTFAGCGNFKGKGLDKWETHSLRSAEGLFMQCFRFKKDLSRWTVDGLTNARYMFYDATKFKDSLKDWRLDSIRHIDYFLFNAKKYKKSLKEWDLSGATSCQHFATDSALKQGDLPLHTDACAL